MSKAQIISASRGIYSFFLFFDVAHEDAAAPNTTTKDPVADIQVLSDLTGDAIDHIGTPLVPRLNIGPCPYIQNRWRTTFIFQGLWQPWWKQRNLRPKQHTTHTYRFVLLTV